MNNKGDIASGSGLVRGPRINGTSDWPLSAVLSATTYCGDPNLIDESLTALFCSNRCPGDLILKTYDLARAMRNASVPVVGGFQTPMEKECLRLLLRGEQPIVICPARGIDNMRIPRDWRPALEDGRLLILSPFPKSIRRPTGALAARRNEFVASIASSLFVIHAATGCKTEALAQEAETAGKPLFTLESPSNANLTALGARAFRPDEMAKVGAILSKSGD